MSPIDPTRTIERMARRLRSQGAPHPVAGAVALAARGTRRLGPEDFAVEVGLLADVVHAAEAGEVPLGRLPAEIGALAFATGADLLALTDLEREWRREPPAAAVSPERGH